MKTHKNTSKMPPSLSHKCLNLQAEVNRLKVIEERLREWIFFGGAPTGKTCTYDPFDKHEIYGSGTKIGDSHICDSHMIRKLKDEVVHLTSELDNCQSKLDSSTADLKAARRLCGEAAEFVDEVVEQCNYADKDDTLAARLQAEAAKETK